MRRGRGTLEPDVIRPHLGNGIRKRPETATAYWDLDKQAWRSFRNLHLTAVFEYYPVFSYKTGNAVQYGVVDHDGAVLAPLTGTTTQDLLGTGFMSRYTAQTGYRRFSRTVLETVRRITNNPSAQLPLPKIMTVNQIMNLVKGLPRPTNP